MTSAWIGAGIRGTLCGFPLTAQVGTEGSGLSWRGTLRIEGTGLHALLEFVDPELKDPDLEALLDEIVGPISAVLDVEQTAAGREISLDARLLSFRFLSRGRSSAFVLALDRQAPPPSSPRLVTLFDCIRQIEAGLGLASLLLAYRRGTDLTLQELQRSSTTVAIPSALSRASWLLMGRFVFDAGSVAGQGMRSLLGITELDLVVGIDPGANKYDVCLAVPSIENKYLTASDLYLLVTLGASGPTFAFRSAFTFSFLNNLTFTAAGSFSTSTFALSAEARADERIEIPLVRGFYFGDVGLLIGFAGGGLTFGLFATLYARELMMFGAVILTIEGEIPVPMLMSGAIDRVSIPSLFENFTGQTIDGLHALDFLALDALHFPFANPFDTGLLASGDKAGIAAFFNAQLGGAPAFSLAAGDIELRKLPNGYGLVDRHRMRHYFIADPSGQVFLQAQFYHCGMPSDVQFGGFTVSPGIFLGGSIEVVGKRFEILFSLRTGEGIFAYAKLDPIDLGIVHITASASPTASPILAPQDDLVNALVQKTDGLVFYLSASKREVTFYFDGRIDLAGLFDFDARIVFMAGMISVHTETTLFGIRAVVALDVSYASLLAAKLAFRSSLDTKALTEGLTAVTARIDGAIQALAKTIDDARQSLAAAQAQVQQLRSEMDALDVLIQQCSDAIADASFWAKPFVAIAKGAEIAAYEVAKAGLWTAIQIATASLELADKVVAFFGNLGADVLSLVNTTIRTASSLLFLRHAEIAAEIDASQQSFSIDVAFVALGKEYSYRESVDGNVLRDKILPFLSERLNGLLKDDLDDLQRGKLMAPRLAEMAPRAAAPAAVPDIHGAREEITRAAGLLGWIQERYRAEIGEDLSDFDALRSGFLAALQVAQNALYTASSSAAPLGGIDLRSAIPEGDLSALSSDDRRELEEAAAEVERKSSLRAVALAALDAAAQARRTLVEPPGPPPGIAQRVSEARAAETPDARMSRLLDEMEEAVRRGYPAKEVDAGYINLSREPRLDDCFSQARSVLGPEYAPIGAQARAPRPPTTRGPDEYRPRLGD